MELRKKGEDWITKVINKMICFLEGGPNLQGVLLPACQRCVNLHALNNGRGLLKAKINLSPKKVYSWGVTSHHDLFIWKSTVRSPCEVTFCKTPFLSMEGESKMESRAEN